MTLDEWVDQQAADDPHLFETNAGGGGSSAGGLYGNDSGGAGNNRAVKNPSAREEPAAHSCAAGPTGS